METPQEPSIYNVAPKTVWFDHAFSPDFNLQDMLGPPKWPARSEYNRKLSTSLRFSKKIRGSKWTTTLSGRLSYRNLWIVGFCWDNSVQKADPNQSCSKVILCLMQKSVCECVCVCVCVCVCLFVCVCVIYFSKKKVH